MDSALLQAKNNHNDSDIKPEVIYHKHFSGDPFIKKFSKKMMQDEEMGPVMLDKPKSQGAGELDDSAMVMRVKLESFWLTILAGVGCTASWVSACPGGFVAPFRRFG